MAQSVEDILRLQLGNLMLQLAMKESEVQALREKLETIEKQHKLEIEELEEK